MPPNQQRSSALISHLASMHARPVTNLSFAAKNNHGLNINHNQDEQEVTVKRMSLWHGALLIDNQQLTSYQHDVSPNKLVRLCHKQTSNH